MTMNAIDVLFLTEIASYQTDRLKDKAISVVEALVLGFKELSEKP